MPLEKAWLECQSCHQRFPLEERYRCNCGGELAVVYDYTSIAKRGVFFKTWGMAGSMWDRFSELLPQKNPDAIITLGEGGTPLSPSRMLASRFGIRELWFKLESCNPTGSFKDRQISVAISKANEWSRTRFGTMSSGNAGVSLSAYCAKAGFEAYVWVPEGIASAKLEQIRAYGARLFMLPQPDEGNMSTHQAAYTGMQSFCLKKGLVPMVTARSANPYIVEGAKAIAFEIVSTLGTSPDRIFVPIGGGGLICGLWKGFKELRALGLSDRLPILEGVQYKRLQTPVDHLNDPAYPPERYYRPLDGAWAWRSIRESNGVLRQISENEILNAQTQLAMSEGIFAEPQGAMAAAGLLQAERERELNPNETVVCLVTGSGLKDMETAHIAMERAKRIFPIQYVASLNESRF